MSFEELKRHLDKTDSEWQSQIVFIENFGDSIIVGVLLEVNRVRRAALGTAKLSEADAVYNAEFDALKRAAVKFGIARELYNRESDLIESSGAVAHSEASEAEDESEAPKPRAEARSMADLVTPKQLGMIRALAREAGVDPDEESVSFLSVKSEALSKRAASSLIDHLKTLSTHAH